MALWKIEAKNRFFLGVILTSNDAKLFKPSPSNVNFVFFMFWVHVID